MKFENILIFSFSHIGDAVLSTAVVPPLQEHFPDSRISVLVGPKASEIFSGDDRFSEIIIYDNRDLHAGIKGKHKLIKKLNARKFDLIVDLRDSLWSRFIHGSRWGMPLLKRRGTRYRESHAVDRYLDILRKHGIEPKNAAPEIRILPSEKRQAVDFLSSKGVKEGDLLVGIHPGGGWPYKLWDINRFAALGDLLNQKYGATVLLFAGPDEAELQDKMAGLMQLSPIVIKNIGLRELSALIQQCRIYIGNDTGPMHVAAAVDTQVVAIFGPTSFLRSGPYGDKHIVIAESIECNPCHPGRHPGGCKRNNCRAMEAVSLEQASDAAGRALGYGQ